MNRATLRSKLPLPDASGRGSGDGVGLLKPRRLAFWESLNAWVFVAPWVLGFLLFTGGPILASLIISFTKWDIVNPPLWIGFGNYEDMLNDALFFQSLKVTTLYALVAVPLQIVVGLFIALLLNMKIKLVGLYRTLFYLPAVLPIVSVAVMWRWILSRDWGLINWFLSLFGIYGPGWLSEPEWALPALILMSLWGVGAGMLIYLAGLQGIPTDLYEAARVDGAGHWAAFRFVTLPMISPVILFQLVVGLISAFQVFSQPFIMTGGGPQNATLFYLLHLFRNAFEFFRMGYASALSWVLFVYIAVLTLLIFRFSAAWVFYEGELKNE